MTHSDTEPVRLLALPLSLACILALGGCSDEGIGAEGTTTVLGDTVIVESVTPLHPEPARLERVQRYGARDDPGPATLVRVMAIAVGPEGSVFLYDMQEGIKKFHVGGHFSGWVARDGAGPGEVRYTTALVVGPGGEVPALDLGIRRFR